MTSMKQSKDNTISFNKKDVPTDPIAYLDLKLKFDIITSLTKSYPNDADLGAKVREFVKLQERQNNLYNGLTNFNTIV